MVFILIFHAGILITFPSYCKIEPLDLSISLRRGHPYYDLWAVASKHPVDENALRQLAMAHFPA
jgi:hypothetical protein